jgi:hypothetical protein
VRASDWVSTVPDKIRTKEDLRKREAAILNMVKTGRVVLDWAPIYLDRGRRRIQLWVSRLPIQIGMPSDALMVSTGQENAQLAVDELNSVLPTAKISDEIFKQAGLQLAPMTRGWWADGTMADTGRMVEQHNALVKKIGASPALVANAGKHWLNHRRLITEPIADGEPSAVNYGWYRKGPPAGGYVRSVSDPNLSVIQGPWTKHGFHHTDYSQLVQAVYRMGVICEPADELIMGFAESCTLPDGTPGVARIVDLYDVIADPELRGLITADPALDFLRHPSVPWQGGRPKPFLPEPPVTLPGGVPPSPPPGPGPGPGPVPPPGPGPSPLVAGLTTGAKVAVIGVGLAAGYAGLRYLSEEL